MSYLLDSDWVIDYPKGRSAAGLLIDRLLVDGIAISVMTYAEVYQGVHFGRNPRQSNAIFQRFLRLTAVYPIDLPIAHRFALIRGELRDQGFHLPHPDILIAATALHYDLTLVTRNLRHYERFPGLRIHSNAELT